MSFVWIACLSSCTLSWEKVKRGKCGWSFPFLRALQYKRVIPTNMIVNLLLQLLDERGVLLLLLGGHHQSLLACRQLLPCPLCLLAASLGVRGTLRWSFFLQICLNARSRTGCFYIPLNWVRTYIFKLLECTKVSELRIYMICISNLIEPRKLQMIIPIWKEVIPSVFPRVQQCASVSPRAVSRGRRSWTSRPPAAASGCSPSGANMNNVIWRQTQKI